VDQYAQKLCYLTVRIRGWVDLELAEDSVINGAVVGQYVVQGPHGLENSAERVKTGATKYRSH